MFNKSFTFIVAAIALALSLQSCSYVRYTTTAGVSPIAESPATLQEKGDIEIAAGFEIHDVSDGVQWSIFEESASDVYRFFEKQSFQSSFNAAVSDQFGIGVGYQASVNKPAVNHTVNGSFQFFKLFPTKEDHNFRVDVKTGLQYNTGKNFMSVDQVYWTEYYMEEPDYTYIYYDYEEFPLGYYKISEKSLSAFVQPSASFENKYFEASIGAVIGYNHIFQYEPEFELRYDEFAHQELTINNPLIYYRQYQDFAFGEGFASIGAGPEFMHFTLTGGIGARTDEIQHTYGFFQIGVKSKFNVSGKNKKSENLDIMDGL